MVEYGDWDIVTNDVESTTDKFGGKWGNLLSKLFNGINIGIDFPLKRPIIRTLWRFGPTAFKIFDVEESNTLGIEVDNIDVDDKILRIKAFTTGNEDYAITELEPQTIVSKVLGRKTGPVGEQGYTVLGNYLDAAGNDLRNINVLGMQDIDGANISVLDISGTGANSQIDFLKTYGAPSGATDVVVSFGNNSKIHKYQWWSNVGGNKKHIEIIPVSNEIDFFSKLDMNEQIIDRAVLNSPDADMLNLLNNTLQSGDATKDIIHRIDIDTDNHAAYINKRENGVQVQVRLY